MNTNRSLGLAVIATMLLCAALVWSNIVSVGHIRELREQLETKAAELQKLGSTDPRAMKPDTGLAEMLAQREAEYAKLRDAYDKLQAQLSNAVPVVATTTNAPTPRFGRGNGGPTAWLERLRLQDPQRYQQMVAAREQRRQQVQEQYQEQMASLENRIQTAPTQEEVDLASQIADKLAKINDLRTQLQTMESNNMTDDQRQQLMTDFRDTVSSLRPLVEQDRNSQIANIFTGMGVKDDTTRQGYVDAVNKVLQDTNLRNVIGGGGPGGSGPWGGTRGNGGNPASNSGSGQSQSSSPSPSSSSATK